jgi:hypothetical protein
MKSGKTHEISYVCLERSDRKKNRSEKKYGMIFVFSKQKKSNACATTKT